MEYCVAYTDSNSKNSESKMYSTIEGGMCCKKEVKQHRRREALGELGAAVLNATMRIHFRSHYRVGALTDAKA